MGNAEEQYQKIIEQFPNITLVDGFIHHVKIPLINDVSLDIDYKSYPKRPKVLMIKPDGQVYKKLDMMIGSLKSWKKKEPPSIVDLINEVLIHIKGMDAHEVLIKKELLEGIMAYCHDHHPREILGLLRTDKGIVSEFILPPGAITSHDTGVFIPSRVPMDSSINGTVHSHPTGNPYPSQADINIFKSRRFHFIIGYPYNNFFCVKCFDQLGNELNFRVIE